MGDFFFFFAHRYICYDSLMKMDIDEGKLDSVPPPKGRRLTRIQTGRRDGSSAGSVFLDSKATEVRYHTRNRVIARFFFKILFIDGRLGFKSPGTSWRSVTFTRL